MAEVARRGARSRVTAPPGVFSPCAPETPPDRRGRRRTGWSCGAGIEIFRRVADFRSRRHVPPSPISRVAEKPVVGYFKWSEKYDWALD